jgi:hypothetical protein
VRTSDKVVEFIGRLLRRGNCFAPGTTTSLSSYLKGQGAIVVLLLKK